MHDVHLLAGLTQLVGPGVSGIKTRLFQAREILVLCRLTLGDSYGRLRRPGCIYMACSDIDYHFC
jgi:hypothetical protein